MKKKVDLDDVDPMSRKVVLLTIRTYCKASGLYAKANAKGIGLDECEESVKELIEYGLLVIYLNEEDDTFTIESPKGSDEHIA